jgi:glucuronyl/N-acetylglucosaminyl transferase EXT2
MRAAAGISDLDYRPGYDISLPAYSLHQEKPAVQKDVRQLLAVMPQIKNIKSHLKRVLKDIEGESTALIKSLENCVAMDDGDERCDTEGNTVKYPEILSDSTFCIVLDTEYDSGQTITEALHHGCIPVIISSSTVLPFSEVIDWKRFSIRLHEIDLSSIQETLSNVSQKRISEMQQQIHFVYEKYFSSWKAIVNTTLLILNDRIVPHHAKNYKHWNLPPTVHESNPLFLRYHFQNINYIFKPKRELYQVYTK